MIIVSGPKTKFKSSPWLIKNDKNSSAMLVPFLDIANHSSTPNCIYSLGGSMHSCLPQSPNLKIENSI